MLWTTIAGWILGSILILLATSFLAVSAYIHYVHLKYSHIPGPPRSSFFLGNALEIQKYYDKDQIAGDAVLDWTKEYGPVLAIYVLWNVIVFIQKPEVVKEMLVTSNSNYRKSPYAYKKLQSLWGARFMGNGLVTQMDPVKWEKTRNLFNPAFHRSYLKTCIDQFNASSDLLLKELRTKADGKVEVSMLEQLNKVAMDIIGKVAFGIDLKIYSEDGTANLFTEAVTAALQGIGHTDRNPWDNFNPSKRARNIRQNFREACQFIRAAGRKAIEKQVDQVRKGQPLSRNVIAHILQVACDNGDGLPEMEEMLDEFVTFFIAGQETTANLLSWTIMELTHNPDIAYRLKTEVDAVLGENASSIAFEDLGKLEYMTAVFKESLRLHPPATGAVREAPANCVLAGVKIPQGAPICVLTYTMSRMEEHFKDALTYNPDRFLHADDKGEGMYAYFPFSVGPRACIGEKFALIEARVVLAKLLQNFEFEWVPGQSMGTAEEITTKPKDGCKCFVKTVSA